MKTDSGLSVYCHGNANFPNVWERCWPTHTVPILVVVSVSYMLMYVPIVMYGLRLFIVVLQELHCLPTN